VLTAFLKVLDEFLADVQSTFGGVADDRFSKCVAYMEALKKTNPKIMVVAWKEKVNEKYKDRILEGDLEFFLNKNYEGDAAEHYNGKVEKAINDLRDTIKEMSPQNVTTCLKYIQNLCKLADLYVVT